MTTAPVDPELVNLIAQLCDVDAVQVVPEAKLAALGLDSVLMVELGVAIEDILGVHLEADDVADVQTVADLAACIQRLRGGASG